MLVPALGAYPIAKLRAAELNQSVSVTIQRKTDLSRRECKEWHHIVVPRSLLHLARDMPDSPHIILHKLGEPFEAADVLSSEATLVIIAEDLTNEDQLRHILASVDWIRSAQKAHAGQFLNYVLVLGRGVDVPLLSESAEKLRTKLLHKGVILQEAPVSEMSPDEIRRDLAKTLSNFQSRTEAADLRIKLPSSAVSVPNPDPFFVSIFR